MRYKAMFLTLFLLSAGFVFAQNETSDPCEGISCPDSAATCPDGTEATCPNSCSGGSCSTCTPDCSGHEAPPDPCEGVVCDASKTVCPDGTEATCPNSCSGGSCSTCTPDCTGHEIQQEQACDIQCGECKTVTDACTCEPLSNCCPNGICEEGEDEENCHDDCGPATAEPTEEQEACTQEWDPVCGHDGKTYSNKCHADGVNVGIECYGECPCYHKPGDGVKCGDGMCEQGEDPGGDHECIEDCGMDCDGDGTKDSWRCEEEQPGPRDTAWCPVDDICPDGHTRPCHWEGDECVCSSCPPPEGCWEERDESGFTRIVCEKKDEDTRCPERNQLEENKRRCKEDGGRPTIKADPRGCGFVECKFEEEREFFEGYKSCLSEEEVEMILDKCRSMGMQAVFVKEGGCNIPKCVGREEWKDDCPPITKEIKERKREECMGMGQDIVDDFDENGCRFIRCGQPDECRRLPPEAYWKCEEEGGELIVKEDKRGCVFFSECVRKGDMSDVYMGRVERVPEADKLLSIAFKLEELKITFDKLAQKTDHIADYYASTGSTEEERFRRVADMFRSAEDKVDEIKDKLKERLEDITIDDLMDIKHDIKYIKDVILKDILYYMLSMDKEVRELSAISEKDCGSDGRCFEEAFRVCKPIDKFIPEGDRGPVIQIIGLEGETCVMKAHLPEGEGPPAGFVPGLSPPYEMTCKIPDYSMIRLEQGPEAFLQYCKGSMVQLVEMFPEGGAQKMGPEPYKPGHMEEPYTPEPMHEPIEREGGEPHGKKPCSGCLDNGICDPGECADCPDCI